MTTVSLTAPPLAREWATATEPDPEHGRAKEPLPTRPPRPRPYITFQGPDPTRSPRPIRPGDSDPDLNEALRRVRGSSRSTTQAAGMGGEW